MTDAETRMTDSDGDRYVVLVDIVSSREIADRSAFESRLSEAIDAINDGYSASFATPLSRMKGIDEFGCVLTELEPLPAIISRFLDYIHPTLARFGVATGGIDIGRDRDTVAEMDGPAFHRANALLQRLESDGLFIRLDMDEPMDPFVSSALNALVLARDGITERQMEAVLAYEEHGTQTAVGEQLGIPQQAVSDMLSRTEYHRRKLIRDEVSEAIAHQYD